MKTNRWRNRILWMAFLVCLVLIFCLTAFHRPILNGKESVSSSDQKHKVVFIAKSTVSGFWKSVYAGASNAATACNLDLTFEGPKSEEDYETQNQMIAKAVEDGAEVIIFSAVDYEANADAINDAAGKGVKVVVIDSDVDSDAVSCRIGTDNYDAGCKAAEAAMKDENEEIHIGIVNYDKNSDNGQKREEGFRDSILRDERAGIDAVINVLSDTENAKKRTKKMLKKHPKINVIVTFNEWTTLGVGYAIQELGLKDHVRVVAFDSNVVSVGMLETGEVDTLIVQNSYAMGYLGVETAYKLINGYSIKDTIYTDTIAVDKENMYDEECQRRLFAFEKSNKN